MPRKKRIINPRQIRVDESTLEKVKRNCSVYDRPNHDSAVSEALDFEIKNREVKWN